MMNLADRNVSRFKCDTDGLFRERDDYGPRRLEPQDQIRSRGLPKTAIFFFFFPNGQLMNTANK